MSTREATRADVPQILQFIRDLAAHVHEPDAVETTEADLHRALFPSGGAQVFAHVAESHSRMTGVAIWYVTFSTWTGGHGIWLEDLFVDRESRGSGVGRELMAALAEICLQRGYRRIDWEVLDFNTSAIGFYEGLGAERQAGHLMYRLSDEQLARVCQAATD